MRQLSPRYLPIVSMAYGAFWLYLVSCAIRGHIFLTPRFDSRLGIIFSGPAAWVLVAAFSLGWLELYVRSRFPAHLADKARTLEKALIILFVVLMLVGFLMPNHVVLGYGIQKEQLDNLPRPANPGELGV